MTYVEVVHTAYCPDCDWESEACDTHDGAQRAANAHDAEHH